jgi:signal transduction histidine kinase
MRFMARPTTLARDTVPALILLVIGLFGTTAVARFVHHEGRPGVVAYALVVVAALALAFRRPRPLAVLAVTAAATCLYLVLGYPYGPIQLSLVVAVFTVGRRLPLRPAAVACALATAALLLHGFVGESGAEPTSVLPFAAWTIVPFAVGVVARVNAEANARARAEQAREYAYEERLRIAQEVHDVVGHGLAAINMQAEIALHLLPKRPEQAGEALTAISRASKEALDELRAALAVVRRSAPPGLARLDDLVERMSGTGVPVTVEFTGTPRTLPVPVDLAAYRLIQESLTNVLRHAGPAAATVRIDHEPAALTVTVTDDGHGGPADKAGSTARASSTGKAGPAGNAGPAREAGDDGQVVEGHGLRGMRERVTTLGGSFEAGPQLTGGFRVRGTFPL